MVASQACMVDPGVVGGLYIG
eukprot:COSAG01_NODE_75366_length_196_cov_478.463918_1_plen_20_part_10